MQKLCCCCCCCARRPRSSCWKRGGAGARGASGRSVGVNLTFFGVGFFGLTGRKVLVGGGVDVALDAADRGAVSLVCGARCGSAYRNECVGGICRVVSSARRSEASILEFSAESSAAMSGGKAVRGPLLLGNFSMSPVESMKCCVGCRSLQKLGGTNNDLKRESRKQGTRGRPDGALALHWNREMSQCAWSCLSAHHGVRTVL